MENYAIEMLNITKRFPGSLQMTISLYSLKKVKSTHF